jgi:cation transport ATPase
MAKQGNCNFSPDHPALGWGSAVFTSAVFLLDLRRPWDISESTLTILAAFALLLTAFQWRKHVAGVRPLLTFLPAIPLAAWMGPHALAAVALAFQARLWLAQAVMHSAEERNSLALSLDAQRPGQATVFVDNDIESEVKASALHVGHIFRLDQGQIVPADGVVTYGSSFVDECFLPNGAERLEIKGMGSYVYAGTRNRNGSLLARASATGEQTFSARLAMRIRSGCEVRDKKLLWAEAGITVLAAGGAFFLHGAPGALCVFLLSSGAPLVAVIAGFERSLAETSVALRCLWNQGGLKRFSQAGMLALPSSGVLSEGRPKLVAVECAADRLTEDAVLGLLGPLARKLETPAGFALLQELRTRNIPLQQSELFQPTEEGGLAFVGGEEIRWVQLSQARPYNAPKAALGAFVEEHLNAGDEVCLMERQGSVQAALAFRDQTVKNCTTAVQALRALSLPILLVSRLPRRSIARIQTELGLEHAQGESGAPETDSLMGRLAGEKLAPAWVRVSPYLPKSVAAVAAHSSQADGADLVLTDTRLPELASALGFGRPAYRRFRLLLSWIYSTQLGFLGLLFFFGAHLTAFTLAGTSLCLLTLASPLFFRTPPSPTPVGV